MNSFLVFLIKDADGNDIVAMETFFKGVAYTFLGVSDLGFGIGLYQMQINTPLSDDHLRFLEEMENKYKWFSWRVLN